MNSKDTPKLPPYSQSDGKNSTKSDEEKELEDMVKNLFGDDDELFSYSPRNKKKQFIGPDGRVFRTELDMLGNYGKDITEEVVKEIGKDNIIRILGELDKNSKLH